MPTINQAINEIVLTSLGSGTSIWGFGSRVCEAYRSDSDADIYIEHHGADWATLNAIEHEISKVTGVQADCVFRHVGERPRQGIGLVAVSGGIFIGGMESFLSMEENAGLRRGYNSILSANLTAASERLRSSIARFGNGKEIKTDDIQHDAFVYEMKRAADLIGRSLVRSALFSIGHHSDSRGGYELLAKAEEYGVITNAALVSQTMSDIKQYGVDLRNIPTDSRIGLYFANLSVLSDTLDAICDFSAGNVFGAPEKQG